MCKDKNLNFCCFGPKNSLKRIQVEFICRVLSAPSKRPVDSWMVLFEGQAINQPLVEIFHQQPSASCCEKLGSSKDLLP